MFRLHNSTVVVANVPQASSAQVNASSCGASSVHVQLVSAGVPRNPDSPPQTSEPGSDIALIVTAILLSLCCCCVCLVLYHRKSKVFAKGALPLVEDHVNDDFGDGEVEMPALAPLGAGNPLDIGTLGPGETDLVEGFRTQQAPPSPAEPLLVNLQPLTS
jgi:hypothetical protein